jgi:hypothetical protein
MDISIFKNKYPWRLHFKTKEVVRKIKGEVVNITTGEILNTPAVVTHKRYDNEKFTKVYQTLINAKYGFKPATQKIVDYIIANIPMNEPVLALDLNVLTAYFRGLKSDIKLTKNKEVMSKPTYYSALKELQESDIIGLTGRSGVWWINANVIHNGSRLIIADIIERVEQTEQDKLEDVGQQRLID